ncbi:MAG: PIN domain-containing protein [Phycisphaerales bacterium]|nr:PIN domain-containing protein [Phycisphaerales bacterium]
MDCVFLDANVLFSAAYRPGPGGLDQLWSLPGTRLCTSGYAASEAVRNAQRSGIENHAERLLAILTAMEILADHPDGFATLDVRPEITLPDKDWPILRAAIDGGCTHLLTGDRRHFGDLYGHRVKGVLILPPGEYIRLRRAQGPPSGT